MSVSKQNLGDVQNKLDNIKEKLSENEYIELCDSLKKVYVENEKKEKQTLKWYDICYVLLRPVQNEDNEFTTVLDNGGIDHHQLDDDTYKYIKHDLDTKGWSDFITKQMSTSNYILKAYHEDEDGGEDECSACTRISFNHFAYIVKIRSCDSIED